MNSASTSLLLPALGVNEVWDKVIFRWGDRLPFSLLLSLSSSCTLSLCVLCSLYLLRALWMSSHTALPLVSERCAVAPSIPLISPSLSPFIHPCTAHECLDTAIEAERHWINPQDSKYTLSLHSLFPTLFFCSRIGCNPSHCVCDPPEQHNQFFLGGVIVY